MPAYRLPPRIGCKLSRYFASGWAFFVPYLAFYWIYRSINGPVNSASSALPALIHGFWALHAVHLLIGLVCLFDVSCRPPVTEFRDRLHSALYWLGLALLLWIPGAYLEYPADTWEHLARTTEWSAHTHASQHSFGEKWTYFFSYSLQALAQPSLGWRRFADLINTAAGLLLCWQYYRFALATGLSQRAARLFVLLQLLMLGNSVFSFYRYYGLSSAVFAQIGAIAIMRIALVQLNGPIRLRTLLPAVGVAGVAAWATFHAHVQGLGIAAFGVLAIVLWRLVATDRRWLGGIFLGAVVLSVATVVFWPRPPYIDARYVSDGWLHSWYGFALLSPDSPASERAWAILGAMGAMSLLAASWLLRRNHVIGWLTWFPIIALLVPAISLPLASVLGASDPIRIVNFARFLFAVPVGLALIALADEWLQTRPRDDEVSTRVLLGGISAIVLALLVLPAGHHGWSRVWNAFVITPADLEMKTITDSTPRLAATQPATPGVRYVRNAIQPAREKVPSLFDSIAWISLRLTAQPRGLELAELQEEISAPSPLPRRLTLADPSWLQTPGSTAGRLSGHWWPQAVALEHAGDVELRKQVDERRTARDLSSNAPVYLLPPVRPSAEP